MYLTQNNLNLDFLLFAVYLSQMKLHEMGERRWLSVRLGELLGGPLTPVHLLVLPDLPECSQVQGERNEAGIYGWFHKSQDRVVQHSMHTPFYFAISLNMMQCVCVCVHVLKVSS